MQYFEQCNAPVPRGRATGCLPRESRPGEFFPLFKERLDVLTDEEIEEIGPQLDTRPYCKVTLDQDGVGSCATEGATGDTMFLRAQQGLPHVLLNPWFIYQKTSGGSDRGSSIDANLRFIREFGIAPESVWPRSKGWRTPPSAEAKEAALAFRVDEFYDITTTREVKSALALGYPVVYGARGHCVLKIKYLGNGKSLDLNSWGTKWEDGGFGTWAEIDNINFKYGAWCGRTTFITDPLPEVP